MEVKRRKERVKFAVAQPEIISRSGYSIQDKRNCWYSRQEYEAMIVQRRLSLQALRNGTALRTSAVDRAEDCVTGLEQVQSNEHQQHYLARREAVVQAVLSVQKWQRIVATTPDPEALRRVSKSISKVSMETALDRASQVTAQTRETSFHIVDQAQFKDAIALCDMLQPDIWTASYSDDSPVVRKRARIVPLL